MHKKIKKDAALHSKISSGVVKLRDAVVCTMGANGSNVIIEPEGEKEFHRVTKDGVSVANAVYLEDGYENMGVSLIVDAAISTVKKVGDGTTTTTLLASEIYLSAFDDKGERTLRINRFKNQIDKELTFLKEALLGLRKQDHYKGLYEAVATLSANNNNKIGKLVSEVYDKVGSESSIRLLTSDVNDLSYEVEDGFSVKAGYFHKIFADNKVDISLEECPTLVFGHDIQSLEQIKDFIQIAVNTTSSSYVVIFAKSFSQEAVSSCLETKNQKGLNIIPVEIKTTDGIPQDIAAVCGCHYLDPVENPILKDIADESHVGIPENIIVGSRKTIIKHDKNSDMLAEHIKDVEGLKENMETKTMKDKVDKRISRLKGKVATIKVGADTESEVSYLYDMLDDSVKATENCIKDGYVLGCGVTYLQLGDMLTEKFGDDSILAPSLWHPIMRLCDNSGLNEEESAQVITNVRKSKYTQGFDLFVDGVKMLDLKEAGIVEPYGLILSCIENSVSVAALLVASRVGIGVVNKESQK